MGCTVKCKISNKNPSDQLHGWQRTITNTQVFFFYSLIKSINRNKDRLIQSNSNSIENETWKVNVFLIFASCEMMKNERSNLGKFLSQKKKKEKKNLKQKWNSNAMLVQAFLLSRFTWTHDRIILSMKKECTFHSEFIIRMEKCIVPFNNDRYLKFMRFLLFFKGTKDCLYSRLS